MLTISYIFLLSIIILCLIYGSSKREDFISRTLEFSDMTMDPINVEITTPLSDDFFQVLGLYIPLVRYNKKAPVEIILDYTCHIVYNFLQTKHTDYRYVSAIYPVFLTILISNYNNIITFDNMLANQTIKKIYIFDFTNPKIIEKILRSLINSDRFNYIYINRFPEIIEQDAYYCMLSSEYNSDLDTLAKNNKFFIIELPENHPNYINFRLNFPSLTISKYDISLQSGINIKKIIFAVRDILVLWSFSNVSEYKIYTLIKTLFKNIENIRADFTNKNTKFIMEYFRPEHMIIIAVAPIHIGVKKYYHELKVYTYNNDPICINTITSIKCSPDILFENRYKLLNLYGTE
jgi:hypothetical protein